MLHFRNFIAFQTLVVWMYSKRNKKKENHKHQRHTNTHTRNLKHFYYFIPLHCIVFFVVQRYDGYICKKKSLITTTLDLLIQTG